MHVADPVESLPAALFCPCRDQADSTGHKRHPANAHVTFASERRNEFRLEDHPVIRMLAKGQDVPVSRLSLRVVLLACSVV